MECLSAPPFFYSLFHWISNRVVFPKGLYSGGHVTVIIWRQHACIKYNQIWRFKTAYNFVLSLLFTFQDLFKEAWARCEIFWKMVDIWNTRIFSAYNNWNNGRFMRCCASNYTSHSRFIRIKVKERIQIPPYLLKKTFNEIFSCLWVACILLPEFVHIFSTCCCRFLYCTLFFFHYSWVWRKICWTTSPKTIVILVVAHRENSLSGKVFHFPEKCRARPRPLCRGLLYYASCGKIGEIYPSFRISWRIYVKQS